MPPGAAFSTTYAIVSVQLLTTLDSGRPQNQRQCTQLQLRSRSSGVILLSGEWRYFILEIRVSS